MLDCAGIVLDCAGIVLDCATIVLDCAGIVLGLCWNRGRLCWNRARLCWMLYRGKIVVSCVPGCERIMPEACEQCEMILVDCRRNVIDWAIVPAYYILNLW